ncbi:hybrid sensor histidine kinase/response regulator [Tahibacter amnicola]|uniref:histidine kinase n=1 Tax=Tahibacter amnicola TaxID=2976241 RepID=A0ABY6BE36_9GAMM|nr:hybrid sensor histidine kinase/response regulator [Tahibacter amnicola]UXI68301.1 hybrid sensor histidine kinase/response regulator [Tahibacter amnicola]
MPLSAPSREPLVLVVDDQPANIQLLGQVLSAAGYEVMPAASGEQALARAQARQPDLVLLDMIMPGMDGFEVCRRLHSEVALAEVPVIFLTAATERDFLVRAFEFGAVDYITKPFFAEELLARVRTHVNLKRANDHLRRIVREREDVTAIVAHDLKNPISNVRFAAQMLRRAGSTADRQVSLIEDIVSCCDEAIEFIQRFLQRRAEIERLRSMVLAPVDLGQLVERAIARQAVAAEAKNLTLSRSGEPLAAQADIAALRNVMQNLLSNAIRYAPVGSEIETRIDADRPGHARVFVMDRGPGIPESERTKLFQRFVRIARTDSTVDDSLSTGLGLAIAKGDIEQMGGYLWYEPRQGGGSVFAFELPLAQAITA